MKTIAEASVWGSWTLDRRTAIELAAHLRHTQPSNILECGSGYSTVVLAEYARDTGARVTTLEHDPLWMSQTRGILIAQGLAEYVDLRMAPLTRVELSNEHLAYWYDTKIPGIIDFALIDGPPGKYGRNAAMHAIMPCLAPKWEAWLDDAYRPGEQAALQEWMKSYGISHRMVDLPHGLAIMGAENPPIHADDLTITITAKHIDQLTRMVSSILAGAPGLLETAHVVVSSDDTDAKVSKLLEIIPFVDEIINMKAMDPNLTMCLLASVIRTDGLWMHLDDRWHYATTQPAPMIMNNVRTLMQDPQIGQIRLQHLGEPIKQNLVDWTEPAAYRHRIGPATYTTNPSIMRAKDAKNLWWPDVTSRREAMKRFAATGLLTAQLIPGAFHQQSENLGSADRSLRYRRGLASR